MYTILISLEEGLDKDKINTSVLVQLPFLSMMLVCHNIALDCSVYWYTHVCVERLEFGLNRLSIWINLTGEKPSFYFLTSIDTFFGDSLLIRIQTQASAHVVRLLLS